MSATGYTAWAVTAGEQPTTAYWNILGTNDASFNNGQGFNDGIIVSRHLATGLVTSNITSNPYKFFASLNGAQASGSSGFFTIALDNVLVDTNNNFDITTHAYTAPVTGFYDFAGAVGYNNSATGQHHLTTIQKNGVEWIRLSETGNGDSSNHVYGGAVFSVPVTQGDVFVLKGYAGSNVNLMNGTPPYCTYFNGRLVSKT